MAATPTSGHSLFAGQSAVVEGVHVDDLLRFHQGRGRRLVFEPPLALEGDSQLVHHGTAEGPLWREEDKMGSRPPNTRPATAAPAWVGVACMLSSAMRARFMLRVQRDGAAAIRTLC